MTRSHRTVDDILDAIDHAISGPVEQGYGPTDVMPGSDAMRWTPDPQPALGRNPFDEWLHRNQYDAADPGSDALDVAAATHPTRPPPYHTAGRAVDIGLHHITPEQLSLALNGGQVGFLTRNVEGQLYVAPLGTPTDQHPAHDPRWIRLGDHRGDRPNGIPRWVPPTPHRGAPPAHDPWGVAHAQRPRPWYHDDPPGEALFVGGAWHGEYHHVPLDQGHTWPYAYTVATPPPVTAMTFDDIATTSIDMIHDYTDQYQFRRYALAWHTPMTWPGDTRVAYVSTTVNHTDVDQALLDAYHQRPYTP